MNTAKNKLDIVLATGNRGKQREIQAILEDLPVRIQLMSRYPEIPEIIEDADTFSGNAEIKARTVNEHTGLIAVADDSGLCVDYLDGRPGVHSARYAGPDADDRANNRKLLAELNGLPPEKRTARFVCNICIFPVRGEAVHLRGECPGRILTEPQGVSGFGYDPLFYYEEKEQTFAQLPKEVKNQVSHRARALAGFRDIVLKMLAEIRGV